MANFLRNLRDDLEKTVGNIRRRVDLSDSPTLQRVAQNIQQAPKRIGEKARTAKTLFSLGQPLYEKTISRPSLKGRTGLGGVELKTPASTVRKAGKSLKEITQQSPRFFESISLSLDDKSKTIPTTPTEKKMFGDKPVFSLGRRVEESDIFNVGEPFTVGGKKLSRPLSTLGVIGMTALEAEDYITPGIQEKKIAQEGLEKLAKQSDELAEGVGKKLETGGSIRKATDDIEPPTGRGGIKPPKFNIEKWDDGGFMRTFRMGRETLDRNIEKIAGEDAEKVIDFIARPTRDNELKRVEWVNSKLESLEDLGKKIGMREDSETSKLVQDFGEGKISKEELKEIRPDDWKDIVEAERFFRNRYDEILDTWNSVRKKFDYDPIPKKENYFRHYQALNNIIDRFGFIFRKQDLPTDIAGLTGIFEPGKPFSTAELRRFGGEYTEDAVGGFKDYLYSVSRQIFHTDSVQRGRVLGKYIDEVFQKTGKGLPRFRANLREWTNLVSGKAAKFDRSFEETLGREIFGLSKFLRKRTSANMVGGNISSALTNFIPLTESLATTSKPAAVRGLFEATMSPLSKEPLFVGGKQSSFLTRRFPKGSVLENMRGRILGTANKPFYAVDFFTSKAVVAGKYFDNLRKGIPEDGAMKLADEYAGRIIGDRTIGQLPNIMNTRTLGPITQFQTEVNNAFSTLTHDFPKWAEGNKTKLISSIGQLVLFSHIYNNITEKITGRRAAPDPIEAFKSIIGMSDEGVYKSIEPIIPFLGTRLPVGSSLPNLKNTARGISQIQSGEKTKGRRTLAREFSKPLFYLAPPSGGSQIKKIITGVNTLMDKGKITADERLMFPAETDKKLRTVVFGPYSSEITNMYYNNDFSPLSQKQTIGWKTRVDRGEDPVAVWADIYQRRIIDGGTQTMNSTLHNLDFSVSMDERLNIVKRDMKDRVKIYKQLEELKQERTNK